MLQEARKKISWIICFREQLTDLAFWRWGEKTLLVLIRTHAMWLQLEINQTTHIGS